MILQAVISDRGLRTLERSFLPTLEKLGKNATMLFSPEDLHFIQAASVSDELQITLRLAAHILFDESSYRCQSSYDNYIAFDFDVGLALKVLRAAVSHGAESVNVKLTMAPSLGVTAGSGEVAQAPALRFSWSGEGYTIGMTHYLPIEKPYSRLNLQNLLSVRDAVNICPFYLDIQPEISRIHAVVDNLSKLAPEFQLITATSGTLHLYVAASSLKLGFETRALRVLPEEVAASGTLTPERTTVQERLEEAREAENTSEVTLLAKHFSRALHSSQLSAPAQLLCGIAQDSGHFQMMFVHRDPFIDGQYDDNISLSYKLPVRAD